MNRRLNYISAAWRTLSHHVRDIVCAGDAEGNLTSLKHRLAMQKIQSDLSLRCLQLSGIEMDQAIHDALRELGLLLDADRTYLFRFDPGQCSMSNTHEWCASGTEPQQCVLQNLPVDVFPWWMERLRRFESLNIPDVNDLPAEASAEKETLQAQSIRSLFVAPVFWQQELLGFMGLDFVRRQQECMEEDRREIVTMTNTLGLLLAHQSAEQALRDQEKLYHSLVEDMPGLVCRFKTDGTLTFVNDAYCHYFEKQRDALVGHSFMPLIPDEDRAIVREIFQSCTPRQPTVEYQHRIILPNGQVRWLRWVDRALFNAGNEIVEYQSLGIDITENRELEARLAQSHKLETIGLLAGGIAHDFNNGLQVMQGFTEIVLSGMTEDDARRDDLKQVVAATQRAQRLTRQLLAFSRSQPLRTEPLNLNDLIRAQHQMLLRVLGEDIRIELELAENIPLLFADPGQLEQIVLNLAVNARDAMPEGGRLAMRSADINLDEEAARQHPDARPVRYVCLAVSDTGCGMSAEVVSRIFEPFFTTKEKGKGTGLGLSTVHGIVHQHGGWTHVYSVAGHGSTFKIYLPVQPDMKGKQEAKRSSCLQKEVAKTTGRILVVEDEQLLANLAARFLESDGHRVVVTANVSAAREAFAASGCVFDMIFTDVVLGDGNGVELADELQRKHPGMHILLTSGYADERSRWKMIEQRGWTCLMKPYTKETLLKAVQAQLTGANSL